MKKVETLEKCVNGCDRPRDKRYTICSRCRHGKPVPCPSCDGLKRPEAKQCAKCHRRSAKGKNHSCWKGGRITDPQGYVRVFCPDDPRANCGRYMKEHLLIMEEMLGRHLVKGETVHHKNGIRSDNRPENLELWSSNHPPGQRIEDKIEWAVEFLRTYAPDRLF